jgi:hypothetical protein
MANIFTLENVDNFTDKINIDDLYERKKQADMNKLELFNKILNRIHVKIKTTSRQSKETQYCWYVVPEMIIGVPRYDQGACIAYVIDKLKTNGFIVRYIHPNMLFISWMHWVPSYVRNELKKKTGIVVNEYGEKINNDDNNDNDNRPYSVNNPMKLTSTNNDNPDNALLNFPDNSNMPNNKSNKKEYTPIDKYKPSGKLIYDDDILVLRP